MLLKNKIQLMRIHAEHELNKEYTIEYYLIIENHKILIYSTIGIHKIHITLYYLCKISRTDKSIATESRLILYLRLVG